MRRLIAIAGTWAFTAWLTAGCLELPDPPELPGPPSGRVDVGQTPDEGTPPVDADAADTPADGAGADTDAADG